MATQRLRNGYACTQRLRNYTSGYAANLSGYATATQPRKPSPSGYAAHVSGYAALEALSERLRYADTTAAVNSRTGTYQVLLVLYFLYITTLTVIPTRIGY